MVSRITLILLSLPPMCGDNRLVLISPDETLVLWPLMLTHTNTHTHNHTHTQSHTHTCMLTRTPYLSLIQYNLHTSLASWKSETYICPVVRKPLVFSPGFACLNPVPLSPEPLKNCHLNVVSTVPLVSLYSCRKSRISWTLFTLLCFSTYLTHPSTHRPTHTLPPTKAHTFSSTYFNLMSWTFRYHISTFYALMYRNPCMY